MIAETPWKLGRFQARGVGKRVLFGRMYEDVAIEREAFRGKRRVFVIASAGCTAIELSGEHEVVACDINPVQLAYAARRIEGGGIEIGDAERGMAVARMGMPLIGWSERRVREFVEMRDVEEQVRYWKEVLDTKRFRVGFDLLMSRMVLRFVYSPELLGCVPSRFGEVLRGRMERGFGRQANAGNPYLKALFLGEGGGGGAVRGEIELVEGDAATVLERCEAGSFDGFTISNILDGAPEAYGERLMRAVRRAAAPGAVMVRRSFGEPPEGMVGNRAAEDRALLWGGVEVSRV